MAELLKHKINSELVADLGSRFAAIDEHFREEAFLTDVVPALDSLELKDRINLVADALSTSLSGDYPDQLVSVLATAESTEADWGVWPLCSFVERHGVNDPVVSLNAMEPLTQHWSCEFAVRPFLDQHLDLTRQYMREWVVSPHETVRRLASEGSRPLLPWGPKVPALIEDPNIGLEALTALRHDTSETVRRSVANHLNDVTKSNPTLVIEVLTKWSGEDPPVDQRLVKHALRSLLKAGNGGAMELVGFTSQPAVTISQFTCTPQSIELGSKINLYAEIASTSKADQRLLVDFVIHHVNASGGTSPKVFKWTNLTLKSKDTAEISKERSIQNRSTRTYHQGVHQVELQVAGKRLAETQFTIE